VPIVGLGVWFLAVKGNYKMVERVFLIFSVFLLSYVVSAIMGKPEWSEIGHAMVHPKIDMNLAYLVIVIGIIGTTIAPWMQFYMQSAVIEKGLKIKDYNYTLVDVIIGCIVTVVVAFFIIVACGSTLYPKGIAITEAKDAALSLQPLAGEFAGYIFAFGLFVASVFSATILPIASSFYICQAFGFEAGIDKKLKEAPQFYGLYTFMLLISMIVILVPNAPLIKITIFSQVLNGMLLPVVLVSMMLLINKEEIMGKWVNKKWQNVIGWGTVGILICLSMALVIFNFIG
jgi:Mn2+/Fe2+ NRAMP family transporter